MSIDVSDAGAAAPDSPEAAAEAVIDSVDQGNSDLEPVEGSEGVVDVEEASDEELVDVIDDEEASEEEVEAAQVELAKRISMKVNGKEQEFDLSNDEHIERLKEMAQKGEGADQKFQEASKMRKQMEAFAQLMQKDPIAALKKLGHDPDKLTESYMEERIAQMQKSPEQIEKETLQKELEEIRTEKERLENERLDAEKARAADAYSRQLDNEITDALATSDMPKSPYVVKRLAEFMMLGLKKDPNFAVKDALPLVERQIKSEIQQMFEAMPEDTVEKILGNNVATKLRKKRLSKAKQVPATASAIKATGKTEINASRPKQTSKPKSAKDFFSDFGDL